MNSNQKLSYAIAAILGGSGAGFVHAAAATDTEASDSIQEITVTAQRRSENTQNVPISIQALTGETLQQLHFAVLEEGDVHLTDEGRRFYEVALDDEHRDRGQDDAGQGGAAAQDFQALIEHAGLVELVEAVKERSIEGGHANGAHGDFFDVVRPSAHARPF